MTLLHWACDRGHKDVVRYLIKNKAKINTQVGRNIHVKFALSALSSPLRGIRKDVSPFKINL